MTCPYCKTEITKEPKRTFKCKGCGEQVFIIKDHCNPGVRSLATDEVDKIYKEQKLVLKALIRLNIVEGQNDEPENMFNYKPIKNFQIKLEEIVERFNKGKSNYDVFIDVCNEITGCNKDNYAVYESIAHTASWIAIDLQPDKVYMNQQLYFRTHLLNQQSQHETTSERIIVYHCGNGCSKCMKYNQKYFPVADLGKDILLIPQKDCDYGYCTGLVSLMNKRIFERDYVK